MKNKNSSEAMNFKPFDLNNENSMNIIYIRILFILKM